ncbi:hypothetical protein GALL_456590 [mine drainage metagenome]|uniref:Uncharacterized protein n=1 Tax=mine drainage metagenome TaxID=410659 RepID=A0A1J5PY26_9ZZZZ
MGSQASGDTGRKICTIGLMAAWTNRDDPARIPKGTAITVANKKPAKTVFRLVRICAR